MTAPLPRIPLSVPQLGSAEQVYVREALSSSQLSTTAPGLAAFEREFEALVGLPSVALTSGTAAIHLGLLALGVGPGDEVVAPTLTCAASINPVIYLGATPAFVDSERQGWNLDPQRLEELLRRRARAGKRPKACIVVHLAGQAADLDAILSVCWRYQVPVLEDAAEAAGTFYKGRPVGTFGQVGAFSFGHNKIITAGGGGMLCAQDSALVARVRSRATQGPGVGLGEEPSEVGYNYRLPEVLAAIGRGQLPLLETRVRQRRAVAFRYRDALEVIPGLKLMPQAPWGLHTNWLSVFTVDERSFGLSRDGLIRALDAAGVEARRAWRPMHRQPLFAGAHCEGGEVAEEIFASGLCLPSSSSLTESDQARVIAAVRSARE